VKDEPEEFIKFPVKHSSFDGAVEGVIAETETPDLPVTAPRKIIAMG
jgi:hypothetical protein